MKKTNSNKYKIDEGLLLLISIVPRNKSQFYIDFLEQYHINYQMDFIADGTAPNEILRKLQLNNSEKKVIFSVINSNEEKEILDKIYQKFKKNRNYNGIAFTIEMKSLIGVYTYQFLGDIRMN